MLLRALELQAFRAWKSLDVRFGTGATVLTGHNGSGKTSILEAAWYAAALRSHRTSADAALVNLEAEAAIVRASVERGARTETIELEVVTKGRARAKLGGAAVGRRRDVLGVLRAAVFAPERLAVVRGDPSDRRSFVDELLIQLHPRFHGVIREYERALRQRNALLRDHAAGRRRADGLEAWDEALTAPGAELARGRADAIARLAPHARTSFGAVGGEGSFEVSYTPNVPAPEDDAGVAGWAHSMRARLTDRRNDELLRGITLVGPHRDDMQIVLAGMPARSHASHGESWLSALALVLGAHAALAEAIGEQPVLLLDDPFTLLDPERRLRLGETIPRQAQVIITAADPSEVPVALGADVLDVEELRGA